MTDPTAAADTNACCSTTASARLRAGMDRAKLAGERLAEVVREHPTTSIAIAAAVGAAIAYVFARRR